MTCLLQVTQTSYVQQLTPCLDRMLSEIMKSERIVCSFFQSIQNTCEERILTIALSRGLRRRYLVSKL